VAGKEGISLSLARSLARSPSLSLSTHTNLGVVFGQLQAVS